MRHAAHVAHHSRGRLRLRVPSAKGDPTALEEIRKSLCNVAGVKDVQINPTIGSVTIQYDPRHHADFEQHLASEESQQNVVVVRPEPKLEDLEEIDDLLVNEMEFLAQHSHSAKAISNWFQAFDRGIKVATNNAVDLKVLVPFGLAVVAFTELGITASTPLWVTLGLFSFNHFVDMHTPPPPTGPKPAPRPQQNDAAEADGK
jgi:hypothetical protein